MGGCGELKLFGIADFDEETERNLLEVAEVIGRESEIGGLEVEGGAEEGEVYEGEEEKLL